MKIRETLSKFLLSILLVSLLSSIASGNTMVMNLSGQPVIQLAEMQPASQFQLPALPPLIGIQAAYADQSITFNDNLVNDCQQEAPGADNFNCAFNVNNGIGLATQVPDDASNLYDVIVTIDGLNDCDEFGAGDSNVECFNNANYLVGPVSQTNDPAVNPVGTNEIDIITDDDMLNDCTEAGDGDNNAFCENTAQLDIDGITQFNSVSGSIGAGFVESNTLNTFQQWDLSNTCDEVGDGESDASCSNFLDNNIGPVDQSNSITGTTPNTIHSNNFEASQILAAENDCDESGAGAGINSAECFVDFFIDLGSLNQANVATGADNAAQINDYSVSQASDLENNCDEFEEGN